MIQSGGGDWIINSIPLGKKDAKVTLIIDGRMSFMETLKPFDLTGTSPSNQKILLCGLCVSVVKNLS